VSLVPSFFVARPSAFQWWFRALYKAGPLRLLLRLLRLRRSVTAGQGGGLNGGDILCRNVSTDEVVVKYFHHMDDPALRMAIRELYCGGSRELRVGRAPRALCAQTTDRTHLSACRPT
jgi:hypothetical protein